MSKFVISKIIYTVITIFDICRPIFFKSRLNIWSFYGRIETLWAVWKALEQFWAVHGLYRRAHSVAGRKWSQLRVSASWAFASAGISKRLDNHRSVSISSSSYVSLAHSYFVICWAFYLIGKYSPLIFSYTVLYVHFRINYSIVLKTTKKFKNGIVYWQIHDFQTN